ncbi:hypothetical protein [Kitasatospora kifunensis]|uniref:Putative ATP-grasp target RiPP n=1 Tax=Kitasatospora kifunensis TaxID=58351 RepID=A0A7W7RCG7_KITKI|nr:hypothetical protein [Kitasatospora kifunensis]MBB4928856.1 putative ATP-grasp target RiPP [Kitasatospora kifunensis]
MSVLTERIPTLSLTVDTERRGPAATRPFGLDALTTPIPVQPLTGVSVDPDTQLSTIDGRTVIDLPAAEMPGSSCQTESDGQTVISVDSDQNDD